MKQNKKLSTKEKILRKNKLLRNKTMDDIDRLRIFGDRNYKNSTRRRNLNTTITDIPIEFKEFGTYKKKENTVYDVVITISSYNRYAKIDRLLTQFFSQETKYTFKIILINDGSDDESYEKLKYKYPDIFYYKNDVGGGKLNYWKTINKLWEFAKDYNSHGIVQLDDDFILCNNFLDTLLNEFFRIKNKSNNYMVFSFHVYEFDKDKPAEKWWYDENNVTVDGGLLIDDQFLKMIDYNLDKIENRVTLKTSSYTWVRLKERLAEFGARVYRFKNSLVLHDGNEDSKLHPTIRSIKKVYTKNFKQN